MKKVMLMMIVAVLMAACSSKPNPVDEITGLCKEITTKTEQVADIMALQQIQQEPMLSKIDSIKAEYSDYELTDADKTKLTEAFSGIITTAYTKSMELASPALTDADKKASDQAISQITEQISNKINGAATLGEALAD